MTTRLFLLSAEESLLKSKSYLIFMPVRVSNIHKHLSTFSMATKLTLEGRKVAIVFETSDVFLASTSPTPAFIRKGRFVRIFGSC